MSENSNERKALERLVTGFTEAFNNEDIELVMSYFAEDAIYDEFNDIRHVGKAAIRAAFVPQFGGDFAQPFVIGIDDKADPDNAAGHGFRQFGGAFDRYRTQRRRKEDKAHHRRPAIDGGGNAGFVAQPADFYADSHFFTRSVHRRCVWPRRRGRRRR